MLETNKVRQKEIVEKIGKRIELLRKKSGITREDLALRIGISHQQLFKYEIGENRITADKLIMIAEILELKIVNFFPIEDVGEELGVPLLENNKDYDLVKNFVKLKKSSLEEILIELVKLIAK